MIYRGQSMVSPSAERKLQGGHYQNNKEMWVDYSKY